MRSFLIPLTPATGPSHCLTSNNLRCCLSLPVDGLVWTQCDPVSRHAVQSSAQEPPVVLHLIQSQPRPAPPAVCLPHPAHLVSRSISLFACSVSVPCEHAKACACSLLSPGTLPHPTSFLDVHAASLWPLLLFCSNVTFAGKLFIAAHRLCSSFPFLAVFLCLSLCYVTSFDIAYINSLLEYDFFPVLCFCCTRWISCVYRVYPSPLDLSPFSIPPL